MTFETSSAREFLTAQEAADLIGVSSGRLRELAGEGKVPHARVGVKYVFHRQALLEWAGVRAASGG